jgi:hypothetical protein
MSALGQKQTFCAAAKMSLFDHLVGYGEHPWRNGQAKKFRGLHINHQLESRGLRDWQVRQAFRL